MLRVDLASEGCWFEHVASDMLGSSEPFSLHSLNQRPVVTCERGMGGRKETDA
jgi:hypothetical protein